MRAPLDRHILRVVTRAGARRCARAPRRQARPGRRGARVPRAGASGNDVTTGDPLYVKARRDVVLGSCATADCLVNGRIAGQKAAAAEPVA